MAFEEEIKVAHVATGSQEEMKGIEDVAEGS